MPQTTLCDRCQRPTPRQRPIGEINRARKKGYGIYCSDLCRRSPALDAQCRYCSKSFRKKSRNTTRPNREKYCSRACYNAWQQTEENRNQNHPNWKHGIEDPRNKNRVEYQEWRVAVYARDDYTCKVCDDRGGKLHAHHVKTYKAYPELCLEVYNGVTLCKSCHIEIHKGPLKETYPVG